jgi:hypothetical protein
MEFFQLTDQTISDITDELSFGIVKGASNNSFQQFEAQTKSSSSLNININVPSENIILSRKIMIQSQLNFEVEITDVPKGTTNVFNYGTNSALQAFPINSLFSNVTCSINNTNVNCNLKDIMPQLLLLNNNKLLAQYNSTAPSQPDYYYKNLKDGVGNSNNVLAGYKNALSNDLSPRGAFVLDSIQRFYKGKGASSWSPSNKNESDDEQDKFLIQMTVTTTEPFIGLSPFIFGDPKHNTQGLVGINSLNFMMNIGSPNRMFSYAGPGADNVYVTSESAIRLGHTDTGSLNAKDAFSSVKVLCNFLTAQDTDVINAKNVCPYLDLPRYITNGTSPVSGLPPSYKTDYSKIPTYTIQTNNLQLNQLPDYFIVVVRKPMNKQTINDSSTFLAIDNVSVSLSNSQGLLSNAQTVDLWKMSVRNGSSQSWEEFSGIASSGDGAVPERTLTTGSLLIINPAMDLSLNSYLSNGSIGQFNFTMQIQYKNISEETFTPEVCIICCNSGTFTTISGSSMVQTGLLTKDIVVNSSSNESMPFNTYSRLIGGNMTDRPLTNIKKLFPKLKKMISGSGVKSGGSIKNSNLDEFI